MHKQQFFSPSKLTSHVGEKFIEVKSQQELSKMRPATLTPDSGQYPEQQTWVALEVLGKKEKHVINHTCEIRYNTKRDHT